LDDQILKARDATTSKSYRLNELVQQYT